jgi:hypothetical protein
MQSLRDVINGMGGNSRETFQQRLARFQEKHREREPEYDPTLPISRPVRRSRSSTNATIVNALWMKRHRDG